MRKEKNFLLDEIEGKVTASSAMIVVHYQQLTPNAAWQLRSELHKVGSELEVMKKQIFAKAAGKSGVTVDVNEMKGHVGVVFLYNSDPLASAKALHQFSESNGQVLKMLFGEIDGKRVGPSDLTMMAKLPGMNEMRATLLGLLTAPMSQMLSVLEAVISEKNEKKE